MSLRAYYLQQMGIHTWVRRSVPPRVSGLHLIAPKQADISALVVFEGGDLDDTGSWIDGAAGRLLKQMLQSIGLSRDNTAVVLGASSMMDDFVHAHVIRLKPRVVLIFSQSPGAVVFNASRFESDMPLVMDSIHPEILLTQPLRKPSAYQDLLQLKALIRSEEHAMS